MGQSESLEHSGVVCVVPEVRGGRGGVCEVTSCSVGLGVTTNKY